jgi:phosphatidylinositol glycan class Q protein
MDLAFMRSLIELRSFFNTAWLILNDMSLGLAFGTFLSENSTILADTGNQAIQVNFPSSWRWLWFLLKTKYQSFLFRMPREVLYWLDAWPAGLKLNAQLSRFYVNTLVGVIDMWECQSFLSPRFIFCSTSLKFNVTQQSSPHSFHPYSRLSDFSHP